ncbi:hypothetical protein D3C78_1301650 [compost metagenome]
MQQVQVFVGTGGNGDGQVDPLAVAPVDSRGELDQAHAGAAHLVAGFRGAVGNGDALTEEGRALPFAGLHAGEVARLHQIIGNQPVGQQSQRCGLVRGTVAQPNLRGSQFQHGGSPRVLVLLERQSPDLLNRFIK